MKQQKAFTIVELLTVIAIIAILIGLLIPSMNMARDFALVAKEKVQIASLDQSLLAFRNDYGDYPAAPPKNALGNLIVPGYCGAQILSEAMFGLDLRGFNPATSWEADLSYYTDGTMPDRKERYLQLDSVDVVDVYSYYGDPPGNLVPYSHVICDVFGNKKINVGMGTKKVGVPVLYYKANPAGAGLMRFSPRGAPPIYRYADNEEITNLNAGGWSEAEFINFLTDPKVILANQNRWPYRPDSYVLISAGLDGEYGTDDDITNFGK